MFQNCSNSGSVTAENPNGMVIVGGIVGYGYIICDGCQNSGTIIAKTLSADMGGILGYGILTLRGPCSGGGGFSHPEPNEESGKNVYKGDLTSFDENIKTEE